MSRLKIDLMAHHPYIHFNGNPAREKLDKKISSEQSSCNSAREVRSEWRRVRGGTNEIVHAKDGVFGLRGQ